MWHEVWIEPLILISSSLLSCSQEWSDILKLYEKNNAFLGTSVSKRLLLEIYCFWHLCLVVCLMWHATYGIHSSCVMIEWRLVWVMWHHVTSLPAECAQRLMRNVNYEIPALKQQIAKCQQTQRVCYYISITIVRSCTRKYHNFVAVCCRLLLSVLLRVHNKRVIFFLV